MKRAMKPAVADNVLELVGGTPIVKLNKVVRDGMADIYAKLESYNPGGSVKDRICISMIEEAEKEGKLKEGGTIVEPTSGNTGIGLAIVGAVKGYKVIITMPESMSPERVDLLRALGADVVLTPAEDGMAGAIWKAQEIAREIPNSFMPMQFDNPANPEIHKRTTAVEILEALGDRIDAFVAGVGTGGTLTGVGEVLKERNPDVMIVAVEPEGSPVLSGGRPGPHCIQGIGAGFIPKVLNTSIIDRVVRVGDEEAKEMVLRLAREEGILAGLSSGAASFASLLIAEELGPGKRVVTIFPHTGERYLSFIKAF
jgi:cysteine synthase A